MWGFEPAVGRSSKGPLLESGAPRLTDRRGERYSARPQQPAPRTFPPSAKRVGACWPTSRPWSATQLDVLLEAEGWNSDSSLQAGALGLRFRPSHSHVGRSHLGQRTLIDYLPEGEQAVDRAGVFLTPRREGLPVTGLKRSPSFPPERGGRSPPHSSREAPSGLRLAPAGLRDASGAGERESAAAGRGKGVAMPRSLSARCSATPADLWADSS